MFFNLFPDALFKRTARYILHRYVGQYMESLSQDQLSLFSGEETLKAENVYLKVEALNELCEQYNFPLEIVSGVMDSVSIIVPWSNLLKDSSIIEVRGLNIVVQPKHRFDDVSMFDSVWSSMTTSLQLAEECLHSKLENDTEMDVSSLTNGLESFAKVIDTVFSKIKVKFVDAVVRIENVIENSTIGVALEIHIKNLDFFDEAGMDDPSAPNVPSTDKTYEPLAYSIKRCTIEGLSLYTDQFSSTTRTVYNYNYDISSHKVLIPGSPEMPPTHSALSSGKLKDEELDSDPILISKLTGKHDVRLKFKQNEALPGPKMDVEFNFGALNVFLSPHQVHILTELMSGLTKPAADEETLKKRHILASNKPMKESDFALIEEEFHRHNEKPEVPSKSLQNCPGWSSPLDESDEEFHPLPTENHTFTERFRTAPDLDTSCSSIGSETRSSVSDARSVSSSKKHPKSKGSNVQALLQDSPSDLTQFRAACSSICIIILHEDVPETIVSHDHLSKTSSLSPPSLKTRSEAFFERLSTLYISENDFTDLNAVRNPLSMLCQTNHLSLIANTVTLEGNAKSSSSQRIFQASLNSLNFQILECLFNLSSQDQTNLQPHFTEILSLKNKVYKTADGKTAEWEGPLFKVKYEQTDFLSQARIAKHPTNKLFFNLGPFTSEVDISIVDRIHCLLNPKPMFCKKEKVQDSLLSWRDEDRANRSSQETEIHLESPFASLNLRFPIPDLRPLHDMDRVPWWQQNLHKEILRVELYKVYFSTTINAEQLHQKIEIQCRDFHASFLESPSSDPIPFLWVSVDPDADCSEYNDFDWPRLVLQIMPPPEVLLLEPAFLPENEDICPTSLADDLLSQQSKEPSPFASNPVVYGTKLLARDEPLDNEEEKASAACVDDAVIMPAEKEKIQEFIDKAVNSSQYILDFNIPSAQLFFPQKSFFELLYNRLANDLVLWEATSLSPVHKYDPSGFKVHVPGLDLGIDMLKEQTSFQTFHTCASEFNNESDSEDESMHYSFNEHTQKFKPKSKTMHDRHLTKLSILLNIKKGTALVHAPIRDSSMNIHETKCGKLQLNVEDCTFFVASSYKGDPYQSYICLLSNKGTLLHNGCTLYPSVSSYTQSPINCRVDNLRPIVYRSDSGVPLKPGLSIGTGGDSLDVLAFVIHISNDVKQQIKTIKIALGINGATLRHYMCPEPQSWLYQFKDFVNLEDFPVSGYTPPTVVTEMHFHFANCSVDYRPLHLPLRTFLKAETLSIASNISASTSSLLLRIISEEMCIFLSKNANSPNVDLKKNYVCVIDTGLIDISFKEDVNCSAEGPVKDLCATNNMIHVRTCVDSCKALQSLLTYLASDGDFAIQPTCLKERKVTKVPLQQPYREEPLMSDTDSNIHNLMAEAMRECSAMQTGEIPGGSKQSSKKARDINSNPGDDEFCILDDDPGVGVLPKSGEPQIRVLTKEPIIIYDNHFSVPVGKTDLLKAPKRFPAPRVCYTLNEMTVVWHIYGGKDFSEGTCNKKKRVRINKPENENSAKEGAKANVELNHSGNKHFAFYNAFPLVNDFDENGIIQSMEHFGLNDCKIPAKTLPWQVKGGPERDHNTLVEFQMNKVRFRHEVYPDDSEFATRDVLLIYDIEVRDRLAASKINKFLYQYVSEAMPRQSSANMVVIKCLHVRPDPKRSTEECSLKVSLKPLRLNIDQDTLMFVVKFIGDVCEADASDEAIVALFPEATEGKEPQSNMMHQNDQPPPTFFRSFTFSPDVPIRLDYEGKRIDTAQGTLQGVFMGLAQLNNSVLKLKSLTYRHGLLGAGKLVKYILEEWIQDIKKNQVQNIIGGIGPFHALFTLVQGLVDFVWYPLDAYRKDGQIVRGFRRGARSFSTSAIVAALELAGRLVNGIQNCASLAFDMVSPTPNTCYHGLVIPNSSRRSSQPADIREGVATAYYIVKEGIQEEAQAMARVVSEQHEYRGVRGAVGGVLRQLGPSLLNPVIHATEATTAVLDGVKNQLKPDAHREAIDKWRTSNT